MIIVDIEVPSVGRKYNFSLDEQISIHTLIQEINEVICQKESCYLDNKKSELCLCDVDNGRLMNENLSLSQYNIRNGSHLLLV